MPVLHRDIETFSTLNLTKVGPWRYAGEPSTGVWCVAFAVDDGPVQIWTPGQPIPQEFQIAATEPDWIVVAHNDSFETSIEERILAPRYGWPLVPIERHRCTQAMALAGALPGGLDKVAAALRLDLRKDDAGRRLMLTMARPRKPRAGEDSNGVYFHDDPERIHRLQLYCIRDTELERALYHRLPPLSDSEQALWVLDQQINQRGFPVDVALAKSASKIARERRAAIDREIAELTGGRITSANQVAKIEAFLKERGHNVASVGKRSVSAVLAHKPSDDVARLLRLRQEAAKASASKLATLLAAANDGRLHNTLKFHGAATGRWSGSKFQPQNLSRSAPTDLDAAIAAVNSGELARVGAIGEPLAVIGSLSRAMICAEPGKILISADYSAIESRVLSWLAGQKWKLQNYCDFDRTGDPRLEPYCQTATRMLGREVTPADEAGRQHGKTADLALGYGGSFGAWRKFMPDDPRSDTEIKRETVEPWRAAHPAIVRYWADLHRALLRAVRTGKLVVFKNLGAEMRSGNLYLRLPSGREIVYPEARIQPGQFGSDEIVFKDSALGKWHDERAWHGIFVENAVSGISRDLLAGAMPRLEAAGYSIVLHVHDEIVSEVSEDFGSPEEFAALMAELPVWAEGLPLVAKASRRQRYAKDKSPGEPADEIEEIEEEIGEDESSDSAETPELDPTTSAAPEEIEVGNKDKSDSTTSFMPEEIEVVSTSASGADNVEMASPAMAAAIADMVASIPRGMVDDDDDDAGKQWAGEQSRSRGNYGDHHSERHAGKPYTDAHLRRQGYTLANVFPYELPDGDKLYEERRYELRADITPSEERPRKTCRFCHTIDGADRFDTGPRRIIYNWPAIMHAGPGSTVHITEGANKSAALNAVGLLATAVAYHKWEPECVAALAGHHLIYHEDFDDNGRKFSADARKHLAPTAASFRIVSVTHLFKQLGREPWPTADVKDWLKAGGDAAKLQRICDAIPAGKMPFPFVDTSRWRTEKPPPREWAVPDRIPRRQVALFSGEGAAGKSTILLHECAAHVLAREWLGVMPMPGPAFFVDAEDDQDEVWRRLACVARHYDVSIAEILDSGFRTSSLFGDDALLATASKGGTIEPTPLYRSLLEAAGDIKPIMIGIASSACVFAGEENNRSQVQQFVGLLTKIAIAANGAVQLISHPSLTGINTDTGLSGTTQWHNAVRARCYLKSIKPEAGEQPDNDLREIVFKKNQYDRVSESIVMRYQNGLFLPVPGIGTLDRAAKEAAAEEVFITLLRRFTRDNRVVFDKPGRGYAPAMFAKEDEATKVGLTSKTLEAAMRELFRTGKIWNEPFGGRPSRPSYRIAFKS